MAARIDGAHIHIQLLGRPCWRPGSEAGALTAGQALAPRDAALLALLALDGSVARDRVAAWLWPESTDQARANLSLRQRLFKLRRDCGHALIETGHTLQLATGVVVDLHQQPLATDEPLLAGLDFSEFEALGAWVDAARQGIGRRQADALAGEAASLEAQGRLAAAMLLCERILARWPATEHVWRRLMRLHWLRADRAAAIACFERFELQVCREWGLRPSSETLDLLARIEFDEAGASLDGGPGALRESAPLPDSLQHPPRLIGRDAELTALAQAWAQRQAVLLLAHRVSGLGVDGELLRAAADFDANTPSFMALSAEALDFVSQFRTALATQTPLTDDGSHLQVIVAQCEDALGRIRRRALSTGTSLYLSYLLTRSEQNLARIRELTVILAASHGSETDDSADTAINAWVAFARAAFLAENRRNSLRHYLSELSRLLAVRVTENAARSGEHYICESSADYRHMWLSAGGAGVLIGLMALLKIKAAALHAPPLIEAFLFSMIYGGGFVLIYLLGMTVATKQPAMTAQTLAGMLGDLRATRNAELERMVDVAAAVSRSQLAAIAGNVLVALPVAIAVGVGLGYWHGEPAVPLGKAAHLLDDLDPLSWAIPHAAIAGFYLFLSGLITGYFDNRASYDDVGPRIGRLRWLRRLVGSNGAQRIGRYISERMGGIMGNFLFGCMLGSTGILGSLVGLPLDIRHIAFASANLGYALTGFDFALPIQAALWALLGIAAIGFTNLAVSFALALRTALGARRVQFNHWGTLLSAIWRRFRSNPRDFLLPPRNASGG
ncbi:MAG: hypothetical protein J0L58_19545 [Burkholderiales bacterium]|nr:hypothetical protein [Burkholderiales bacterium]